MICFDRDRRIIGLQQLREARKNTTTTKLLFVHKNKLLVLLLQLQLLLTNYFQVNLPLLQHI